MTLSAAGGAWLMTSPVSSRAATAGDAAAADADGRANRLARGCTRRPQSRVCRHGRAWGRAPMAASARRLRRRAARRHRWRDVCPVAGRRLDRLLRQRQALDRLGRGRRAARTGGRAHRSRRGVGTRRTDRLRPPRPACCSASPPRAASRSPSPRSTHRPARRVIGGRYSCRMDSSSRFCGSRARRTEARPRSSPRSMAVHRASWPMRRQGLP